MHFFCVGDVGLCRKVSSNAITYLLTYLLLRFCASGNGGVDPCGTSFLASDAMCLWKVAYDSSPLQRQLDHTKALNHTSSECGKPMWTEQAPGIQPNARGFDLHSPKPSLITHSRMSSLFLIEAPSSLLQYKRHYFKRCQRSQVIDNNTVEPSSLSQKISSKHAH